MRYFLLAFSIVLIISACSDSPAAEKTFKEHRIGAFNVVSLTKANFVGTHQKNSAHTSAADTIIITEPGQLQLIITEDTTEAINKTTFDFIDNVSPDSIKHQYTQIYVDSSLTDDKSGDAGARRAYNRGDHYEFQFDFDYDCGAKLGHNDLYLTTFSDFGRPFRVYKFQSPGLQQVISELSECHTTP